MSEFKSIPIAKIHVPARLRTVEVDHALAIQASIVEHGLINPITVRHVPNQEKGKKPYVLIAGAHRLHAVELLGESEIEALIVKADADEAQLLEITENLFRNELSALDRAIAVVSYRDVWERKHGAIRRGGDQSANIALRSDPISLIEQEAVAGFSQHVAERLGVSRRTVMYAQEIALKLIPDLRVKLRGTASADNQSLLLRLARLDPARQRQIATAIDLGTDAAAAIDLTEPAPKERGQQANKRYSAVLANFRAMAEQQRRAAFLDLFRAHPDDARWALENLDIELRAED